MKIFYHSNFLILNIFLAIFLLTPLLNLSSIYAIECKDGVDIHQEGETWQGQCFTEGKRTEWICPVGNTDGQPTIHDYVDDSRCPGTTTGTGPTVSGKDIRGVLGQIKPPDALLPFINRGGNGGGGISLFLNNLVILIYVAAAVVFVFMLLWGAWDFITSGGEKEKVQEARNRIMYAIIGLILFAVAVAALDLIGTFTGFTFVEPTNPPPPAP